MGVMGAITSLGYWVELIDYPAFITIADADYTNDTPAYLPGGRVDEVDAEGEPTGVELVIPWNQWRIGDNLTHTAHEGNNYIPLTWSGQHFAGSLLSLLLNDSLNVQPMSAWPVIESEGV
jgi:hypothetical protein